MNDLLYKVNKTKSDIDKLLAENKRLVYHVLKVCNVLDNQDAESAAWEALWDAINLFDIYSNNSFSTYAYTVIRNAVYDVLRRQRRVKEQEGPTENIDDYADKIVATDTEDISDGVIKKLFDDYIIGKQGKIRDVLLFWYSCDFEVPATQIALACGCSKSYVSRVQDAFRAFISGKL